MMDALDTVFAEAKRRGFRLCNFFEIEPGRFRCNWIADGEGRSFGTHSNPGTAAAQALRNAIAETENDEEDLIG